MNNDQKIIDWQKRIQQWQSSGLTQKEWCRQHNIRPKQFWYWKDKLSSLQPVQQEMKTEEVTVASFVPVVTEATSPSPVADTVLTVSLPSGTSITGIGEHNVQLAGQLLRWVQ